jgi:Fe-S-cluster containining protein
VKDVAEAYAWVDGRLPERACGRSGRCCQLAVTGLEPVVTEAEVDLLVEALRRQGRSVPRPRPDGACPLLDATGVGCLVYASRPLGCRTYFCREAGGKVPARVVREAIQTLNALDEARRRGPTRGRPLRRALEERRRGRATSS